MPSVLEQNMGKKKGGDEPPKKNPTTTKVDAEILRMAKIIATYDRVDLYEYLDSLLRARVIERYHEIVREPERE